MAAVELYVECGVASVVSVSSSMPRNITHRAGVALEKLMVAKLTKKFFELCGTQGLITVLIETRCWCIFPSHTKLAHSYHMNP
jgi:hypothetical protein